MYNGQLPSEVFGHVPSATLIAVARELVPSLSRRSLKPRSRLYEWVVTRPTGLQRRFLEKVNAQHRRRRGSRAPGRSEPGVGSTTTPHTVRIIFLCNTLLHITYHFFHYRMVLGVGRRLRFCDHRQTPKSGIVSNGFWISRLTLPWNFALVPFVRVKCLRNTRNKSPCPTCQIVTSWFPATLILPNALRMECYFILRVISCRMLSMYVINAWPLYDDANFPNFLSQMASGLETSRRNCKISPLRNEFL